MYSPADSLVSNACRGEGFDDLERGNNCLFACTGITESELVRGVHYRHESSPFPYGEGVRAV